MSLRMLVSVRCMPSSELPAVFESRAIEDNF